MEKQKGFIQFLVVFSICFIVSIFGILNLLYIKDKFFFNNEVLNIYNNLYLLENSTQKKCLEIKDGFLNVSKDDKKPQKQIKINKKISVTLSTNQICCTKNASCSPSSIKISYKDFLCKISISLRGQISKTCKKE